MRQQSVTQPGTGITLGAGGAQTSRGLGALALKCVRNKPVPREGGWGLPGREGGLWDIPEPETERSCKT